MSEFEVKNEMVETEVENVQVAEETAPAENVPVTEEPTEAKKGYGLLVKGLLLAGGMYAAYRAGKKAKDKDPSEKKPGLIQKIKDKFSKKTEAPAAETLTVEATTVELDPKTNTQSTETN